MFTLHFAHPIYDGRDAIVGCRFPQAHPYAFYTKELALKVQARMYAQYERDYGDTEVEIVVFGDDGKRVWARPEIDDEIPF